MRGRKPERVRIARSDRAVLEQLARREVAPWYQVRRACILLAMAGGARTRDVAWQMQCDTATVRRTGRRYEAAGLADLLTPPLRSGHPERISPLERAQIGELACLEPIAKGLHITHWSSGDLARQVVTDGIVETISAATVRRILAAVDLQPHRTRHWRTARLDAEFKARAEKVLWCYAHAERLAHEGLWVVSTDEMPNRQALERRPVRRAIPGAIEQQEFEYVRHGTVNILTVLIIDTGRMAAVCVEANDAAHYIPALEHFRQQQCRRHPERRGIFLIHDGGASHTAQATSEYFSAADGRWRPRLTPAHASWMNQSELLNHAFDRRYLKRGSWASAHEYITHVRASAHEYNRRYAHPFEWTWTNHQMRRWFATHTPA